MLIAQAYVSKLKQKADKYVWRLIDEDDYAELEPIRFGDENDSDNGRHVATYDVADRLSARL